MSGAIHCYEYVNQPYDRVSDALVNDGLGLFQRATTTATDRAHALVAKLNASIAGFDVSRNVVVRVRKVNRRASPPGRIADHATELDLEWEAEKSPGLFPAMRATLTIYPLSRDETQLQLEGVYEPPGGVLGEVADKLVGRRIAEASVHAFLGALARQMNQELASAALNAEVT